MLTSLRKLLRRFFSRLTVQAPTFLRGPTLTLALTLTLHLSQGWEFVFDPEIEQAGVFVQRMRKWEESIGGEKKAVLEWDLEGEQQPFVGENKHD